MKNPTSRSYEYFYNKEKHNKCYSTLCIEKTTAKKNSFNLYVLINDDDDDDDDTQKPVKINVS